MLEEKESLAAAKNLLAQYKVLTMELLKFLDKGDIDTFFAIVPQRGTVVDKMKALPPEHFAKFRETEDCKAMLDELKPIDMQIIYKAKTWLNKSRRQNMAVTAYDVSAMRPMVAGNIFNKRY